MISIVSMSVAHAAAVLRIYQAGIDTGDATFETPPLLGKTSTRYGIQTP